MEPSIEVRQRNEGWVNQAIKDGREGRVGHEAIHRGCHGKSLNGNKAVDLSDITDDPVEGTPVDRSSPLQGDKMRASGLQSCVDGMLLPDNFVDVPREQFHIKNSIAGEAHCCEAGQVPA